nr:hypothetical protein VIGAN_01046000 [Ipomoea batatas]
MPNVIVQMLDVAHHGGRWCGVTTMVSRSESKERNVGVSSVREVSPSGLERNCVRSNGIGLIALHAIMIRTVRVDSFRLAMRFRFFTALACSEANNRRQRWKMLKRGIVVNHSSLLDGVVNPQPKPDFLGRIYDLDDPFPPRPLPNSPELPNPVNRRRRCFLHLRNRPLLAGINGVNINGSFNIDFMDISPYSSPLIQLLFITGRIGSIQVRYPNLLQIGGAIHRPLPALGNIPGFKAMEGLAIFL